MRTQKPLKISSSFSILMVSLNTLVGVLPGILLLKNTEGTTLTLFSFFLYLVITEFFQYFIRISNKTGASIIPIFYIAKILVSAFLLVSLSNKTTIQYGIILACYEVFQYLCYTDRFNYMNSFLYLLVNSFFKGIVFNQLFIIKYPFHFSWKNLLPFTFSFIVVLLFTSLLQGFYSRFSAYYLFISTLIFIGMYLYIAFAYVSHLLVLWKVVAIIIANIIFFWQFFQTPNPRKKEFLITLFILFALGIYYI